MSSSKFEKIVKIMLWVLMIVSAGITAWGYAVGFSDPKYFAKCFKEEYGMTPTQFQAESRGTAGPDETAAQP